MKTKKMKLKEIKKNNIITLAIGGSIVLIVILALIISTIKNKSKKSEGKELETSFNSIFNIDKIDYVLNQNSMSSSSLIRINNKYLIELSDTEEQETKFISTSDKTKQEIQSIWLLHPGSKSGRPIPTIIISKKDYKIKFYNHQYNNHSNEWYYQVYKEISLKPLNIPSNTEDKTQEESDKKVKNELKNNSFNENITSSIENFLTDLRISSTVNREEIIKFLTNIKKNLDKEIEIYLQQQKEALAK